MTALKPFRDSGELRGDTLRVRFLEERGQTAPEIAGWLAEFIDQTHETLDIAIYDCNLSPEPAAVIRDAFHDRLRAGVRVRLVFDAGDKPRDPAGVDAIGADYAPPDSDRRVRELGLLDETTRPVSALRGLMHHKYLIRDGQTVWTGSLNWSDDAMSRMDNLLLTFDSKPLAGLFTRDFEGLWQRQTLDPERSFRTDADTLRYHGDPAPTDVDFSPGQGEQINEWVAARVRRAKRRIVLCSMLFTSSKLLSALVSRLDEGGVEFSGLFDASQMADVLNQWRDRPDLHWKIAAVHHLIEKGALIGKQSEPYRPGQSHNFMHNKTLVIDDTVITGSYNLSHAARVNAENMLAIESADLAARVIAYTRHLVERYGRNS